MASLVTGAFHRLEYKRAHIRFRLVVSISPIAIKLSPSMSFLLLPSSLTHRTGISDDKVTTVADMTIIRNRDTKEDFMRALGLIQGQRESDRLYQAMRVSILPLTKSCYLPSYSSTAILFFSFLRGRNGK